MSTQSKIIALGGAILVLGGIVASGLPASAADSAKGAMRFMHRDKGKHEVVVKAIEAGDYAAFKQATEDKKIGERITEENFPKLVEMHTAMKAGDYEKARQLHEALGLKKHPHPGKHSGQHKHPHGHMKDKPAPATQ